MCAKACELKEQTHRHVQDRMHVVQTGRTCRAGCTFNRVGRHAPLPFPSVHIDAILINKIILMQKIIETESWINE